MTTAEIQAKSREKLQKINDLIKELNVKSEVKQRVMPNGFIEDLVIFIDLEEYPMDPVPEVPKE